MISSDESSSDDGGFKESNKTGSEHGKKKPQNIHKNVKTQIVCETVVNNRRDKKKMCKSDFIKSATDSSLDSDNLLDISSMKKQKLKKRRLHNFPSEVHSPMKRNKLKDESCSSLSENEEPSTSQRKRRRKKLKKKILTQDDSDECSDKEIGEVDHSDEATIQHVQNLDDGIEDENDSDVQEDEFAAIKKELSEMSFEERAKLRDKLGIKVYNQVVHGERKQRPEKNMKRTFKRENKNRPVELSSKKRTPFLRNVIPVKKKIIRDPRFDDLSGEFNEHLFKQSYGFIDDIKAKEKQKLEKLLRKEKDSKKKENIKFLLNRMRQEEVAEKKKKERRSLEKQWKKKEMTMVHDGKTPFFLKKGDLKKMELAEKYKELQKSGKLDNYLSKKRKKNASKEKKKLPT
ncbi:ribosomal RNA processing protein 36 homolog [Gigantopelta aegis]|uniref:ribosomal RNA processing protein 36 homolog n=1 Tax=Gigantopelta aegis TaxID=1735272 RepID=UPI001B889446|nr:ribosomal RNA processing protein 36 homolog [Gigantopelta aegis]XP_041352352.1 ribosomal RNA processing protein 36 homolog [Gigantopelta aegis]